MKVMSSQNISARQRWLRLHRWVGLFLLLLSLPIGLTGSLNVYHREIDAWLNPTFYRARASGRSLPLNQILARVRALDPSPVVSMILPEKSQTMRVARDNPDYGSVIMVHQRRNNQVWRISLDPVSGEILGQREQSAALMPTIYRLHESLLLKPYWGEEFVGLVGLLLGFSCLSGLWLWWPKPGKLWRAMSFRWGQPIYRGTWEFHNALGFWTSLVLLVVSVSGVALVFPNATGKALRASEFRAQSVEPGGPRVPDDDPDGILAAALAHRPHDVPLVLGLPNANLNTWRVAMRPGDHHTAVGGLTQVWINPWTYQVAQEKSNSTWTASDRLVAWKFPIHNGSLWGDAGRFLVFLSGFAFPALAWSGAYLWWRKRQLQNRALRARRGLLPPG